MMGDELIEYPEFFELVNRRYSCRSFSNAHVSRNMIMAIMETVRLAPSACNKQPWKFLVIDTPDCNDIVRRAYNRDWFNTASTYVVALGNHSEAWHRDYDGKDSTDIDIAIACTHICLAATSLQLASCWVGNFDKRILAEGLDIPQEWEPITIIPIGYPATQHGNTDKKRNQIDNIVKWGKF